MPPNFIRSLIKKSVSFGIILASADATVQLIERYDYSTIVGTIKTNFEQFVFPIKNSLATADATVQLIERYDYLQSKFNWNSLARHGLIGSCVIGPVLCCYYFALDKRLPGTCARTVATKVALDVVCANLVYYCLFYYCLSFLEHKSHERAKKDTKDVLGKSYMIGCLYWMPLMAINFKYLSPQSRVIFVAMASYIEMNWLCLMSRGEKIPLPPKVGPSKNVLPPLPDLKS